MRSQRMPENVFFRGTGSGRTWYIRYRFDGQQIRERVGRERDGVTLQDAINARKAREGEIVQGRFRLQERHKPLPFRDLIARYKEYAATSKRSYQRERYTLDALARTFGALPVSKLTTWRIEQWKAGRRKQVTAGTLNRELTTFKALLSKAVAWKLVDTNPAAGVKYVPVDNRRLRWLTADELTLVLAAAAADIGAAWLAPAIELAVHTGIRQGELLGLRWQDVSSDGKRLSLWNTKNGKPRHVPVNETARAALDRLPRDTPYVLARPWGEPISRLTLYAAFERTIRTAGIAHCTWHDLRHTFASHLVMAGVSLAVVKELLGHATIEMTMRYAHLAPQHTANAVESLTAALTAPIREVESVAVGTRQTASRARSEHAPSGRQSPAKAKYLRDQRLGKWTRSQPIRTAGLLRLEFPIVQAEQSFAYQRIAPEAVRLRRLGLTDALAARALGVTDKTIAKAVCWWRSRFGA